LAEAIRIGEPEIEIRLRRNPQARRMVLRVAHHGRGPTLTLPPGVSLARATAFLCDQEAWLRQHLATNAGRVTAVGHGSVLPFGGGKLTVRLAIDGRIRREGNVLSVAGPAALVGPRVAGWLREEARRACVLGVERYAGRLGLRAGRVTLRDPKSRWGSCTSSGDLMFSWRLVMAPSPVLDYVVAHEVAHLAELNHSPRFWAVVRRLCPGMDEPREWLRRNGATLHRHDFGAS
jgi:predicted metal-dependent hydrolase